MSDTKRRALITGGAQGIGFGIATRLAEDGHHVIIADVNGEAADKAATGLRDLGHSAEGAVIDVSKRPSVEAARKAIGAVDILVNNAGIYRDTPLLESPPEDWMVVFDINLYGSIHCTQVFGADMAKGGWGRIINLGSLASATAYGRDLAYVTTKTAVAGLTRVTAVELGPNGVTANAICPGNIMTDMMRHVAVEVEARDGLEPGTFLDTRAKEIPARRLGAPSDIASMASFLCRDDAEYVNGQLLHVNGGLYFG